MNKLEIAIVKSPFQWGNLFNFLIHVDNSDFLFKKSYSNESQMYF